MQYSGAGGKLIHQKNQEQKISWHCPFKWGPTWNELGFPEDALPGMNWGFLKNQSMTRTVKLKRTAAWWKVMGPSSLYLASSILRTVSPSAMSNFDFLQCKESAQYRKEQKGKMIKDPMKWKLFKGRWKRETIGVGKESNVR